MISSDVHVHGGMTGTVPVPAAYAAVPASSQEQQTHRVGKSSTTAKRKWDGAREARDRLKILEALIREHLGTGKFFLVAAALREIDDSKLYEPEKSIYTYAKNKFSFSRRTTNTYLCSASVYESIVEDKTLPVPVNISHIRSLHKFPPDARRFIWRAVCDSGQTITEEHVVAMTVKHETGVHFTDLNNEIYTPKEIITAAKQVINKPCFDIDPASCHFANKLHPGGIARTIYDEKTDGLQQTWQGHVWLSPPLGTDATGATRQNVWFLTAEEKFLKGEIESCLVLLQLDFGTDWFARVQKYPHCFFASKLQFSTPTGREKCLQDAAHLIVYMGLNTESFCTQFGRMGTIPGYSTWAYGGLLPSPSATGAAAAAAAAAALEQYTTGTLPGHHHIGPSAYAAAGSNHHTHQTLMHNREISMMVDVERRREEGFEEEAYKTE
ncbi:hypothetical protein HK104_008339 [Borealophlyctis nickersoniae]|nr:hypothetical protein HK104_008339 [Borealophlyctis nickersoniae]